MKNMSKLVQLALLLMIVFTGQKMFTGIPKRLAPVYKTPQQLEQEAVERQQAEQRSIKPSAPPANNLYPTLNGPTAPSTPRTQTSINLPPERVATSSQVNKKLTKEEQTNVETAAQSIKNIWRQYYLAMQGLEENEKFDQEDYDIILQNLRNLSDSLDALKNPELKELYAPIEEIFYSKKMYTVETVATHLFNLIGAINTFAGTSYDLKDIVDYVTIEANENPFYSTYTGMTDWLYSWGDKPREAWTSAKQAATSTWDYAKQKVQHAKSFVGQPSKEEFDAATHRLSEIKRIEGVAEGKRNETDQIRLHNYKLTESQDKAMVAKWWPYLVTVATLGAFYYMFPEFSKNVAGYGAGAVGYVAKPAAYGALGYGGYQLWKSDKTKETGKKGIPKPIPMKKQQAN